MQSRRSRVRGLTAAALLLSLGTAWPVPFAAAQTASDKKVAKAKVLEGSAMLKRGEFRDALARFQEAYTLVQSPRLQYNVGLALLGLGRDAEALGAFERFLEGAPDAPADTRDNAREHRERLLKTVATLDISSPVSGAEVFIDGVSHGKTPLGRKVHVDPGPHQVVVQKDGTPQMVERITPEKGQEIRLVMSPNEPDKGAVNPRLASASAPEPGPSSSAESTVASAELSVTPERAPGSWKRTAAWATAGGAGAFLIGGVVSHLVRESKYGQFNKECRLDQSDRVVGPAECSSLHDSGSRATTFAVIGYVGAGALAATSAALFLLAPEAGAPAKAGTHGMRLACAPSLGGIGVSCATRF